jgi:hypothetical protein
MNGVEEIEARGLARQPQDGNSRVVAGCKAQNVGKIQIECDERSPSRNITAVGEYRPTRQAAG